MQRSMLLAWDFVADITATIGGLLYRLLGSIFCRLLDWVQSIFRSLAGLNPIVIDGATVNQGDEKYDIVYWLLQTDIVQDVFWAMVTFSLILMFLMTGLAIIRNAYQDKPKPIGGIIGGVFKGLLGMILLPIACMVGLMFGNIILLAVDSGTSVSGSQKLSGTLFISAAYDANICRDGNPSDKKAVERRASNFKELIDHTDFEDYLRENGLAEYGGLSESDLKGISPEEWEALADAIDDAFAGGFITYNGGDVLDTYDTWKVQTCYNLFDVNYVVFVVGGVLMLGFIFKMCFGLIGRIFKLTIDFVLIPVVMAMMPFDTKPSQTWKGDFVKNTVVAYSTVGVMNLFYSILPIVNKIEFSPESGMGWTAGIFSSILKLIITIVGLFSAESIISSVSGWFGTGDLLKEGKDVYGTFKGGMEKIGKQTGKVTGGVGKFVGSGIAGARGTKGFGGHVGGFFKGGFSGTVGASFNKKADESAFFKGIKEGEKSYKDNQQSGGFLGAIGTEELKKTRAARAELKNDKSYANRLEPMQTRLGMLTPSSQEYKDLEKRINLEKSKDSSVAKAVEGGYKMTHGTQTKTIKEFEEDLTYDKELLEKSKSEEEALNSFADSHEDYVQSVKNAGTLGIRWTELRDYLYEGKTTVLRGKDESQLNVINTAKSQFDESLKSIRKVAKHINKTDPSILGISDDAIDAMKPIDLLKKLTVENLIYDGNNANKGNVDANTNNFMKQLETLGATNRTKEDSLDKLSKEIIKQKANLADDLHSGNASKEALQAYDKGNKK